jgi:prepilin signal peptidase PulO-like enzyme (type II secretory pathway)
MLAAGSLGLILAACAALAGRDLDAQRRRPFGPALCLAFQTVWLHGAIA